LEEISKMLRFLKNSYTRMNVELGWGEWKFTASSGKQLMKFHPQNNPSKMAGTVAQAVECQLCKLKALSSNPSHIHTHKKTNLCNKLKKKE
jgi:hypothetical protein